MKFRVIKHEVQVSPIHLDKGTAKIFGTNYKFVAHNGDYEIVIPADCAVDLQTNFAIKSDHADNIDYRYMSEFVYTNKHDSDLRCSIVRNIVSANDQHDKTGYYAVNIRISNQSKNTIIIKPNQYLTTFIVNENCTERYGYKNAYDYSTRRKYRVKGYGETRL